MARFTDSTITFQRVADTFNQINQKDAIAFIGLLSIFANPPAVIGWVIRNMLPVGIDPRGTRRSGRTVRLRSGGNFPLADFGLLPTERIAGEIIPVGIAGNAIIYDCAKPEPLHVANERARRGLGLHPACVEGEVVQVGEQFPEPDPALEGPTVFGAPIFATKRGFGEFQLGEPAIVGFGLFPRGEQGLA